MLDSSRIMAQLLKIRARVSDKTLTLSELDAFEGKLVRVTIEEAGPPPDPSLQKRELGLLRGKIWIADDFDAPLPSELQRHFEGGGD